MSIQKVIRDAMIEFKSRGEIFDKVQKELNCSRGKVKQLVFAFLWQATEDTLQRKYSEENWGV